MADRILRWFVEGQVGSIQAVGGAHRLDADYHPIQVNLLCREASKGDRPTKIDITDDGDTIFAYKPTLIANQVENTEVAFAIHQLLKGSIIKLFVDQVANIKNIKDLTVELELERA